VAGGSSFSFAQSLIKEVLRMDANQLEAMKNLDIQTLDPATLADSRDVTVDTVLPPGERLRDYLRQIKNPYCFRYGKTAVKLTFADTEATMEDRLEEYFLSL